MVNLLFAGNNKVFNGMMLTLLSATKHTKEPINAYCLTMDLQELNPKFIPIQEEQASYLREILKSTNPESDLKLIDLTDMFKNEMIDSVNIGSHFTPYSMLRLFADRLPELPEKILYLDTDTLINNNLQDFYDIDIENYEIACVKDAYNWASPSRWLTKGYFNAGVLLLNLKKIRETGMFTKARQLCHDKKMLPLKYNAKDKYFPEIVVHHFCNVRKNDNWFYRIKPWEVELVKTKMSAYNDILDDFTNRIKNLAK